MRNWEYENGRLSRSKNSPSGWVFTSEATGATHHLAPINYMLGFESGQHIKALILSMDALSDNEQVRISYKRPELEGSSFAIPSALVRDHGVEDKPFDDTNRTMIHLLMKAYHPVTNQPFQQPRFIPAGLRDAQPLDPELVEAKAEDIVLKQLPTPDGIVTVWAAAEDDERAYVNEPTAKFLQQDGERMKELARLLAKLCGATPSPKDRSSPAQTTYDLDEVMAALQVQDCTYIGITYYPDYVVPAKPLTADPETGLPRFGYSPDQNPPYWVHHSGSYILWFYDWQPYDPVLEEEIDTEVFDVNTGETHYATFREALFGRYEPDPDSPPIARNKYLKGIWQPTATINLHPSKIRSASDDTVITEFDLVE